MRGQAPQSNPLGGLLDSMQPQPALPNSSWGPSDLPHKDPRDAEMEYYRNRFMEEPSEEEMYRQMQDAPMRGPAVFPPMPYGSDSPMLQRKLPPQTT